MSPTALVTGASSGIGEAYARLLAARGHDLVVVARSEGRLRDLERDLERELRVDVEVLPADLADPDQLAKVEARAAQGVDLLVNNAGFGTTGRFHELPVDKEEEEIRLNVTALVRLTHAALPPMLERGAGGVINVSSIAGFSPGPGTAVYSATKAFVTSFSESLAEELRGTGVRVQVVTPGPTRTEWQSRAGYDDERAGFPSFAWQTAEEVAAGSLRALDRGVVLHVPKWTNKAVAMGAHLAPRSLLRRVSGRISNQL